MPLFKKGTSHSSMTVSTMVYVCSGCGHTEIASSKSGRRTKKCPRCHSQMSCMPTSADEETPSDNDSDSV